MILKSTIKYITKDNEFTFEVFIHEAEDIFQATRDMIEKAKENENTFVWVHTEHIPGIDSKEQLLIK